MARLRKRNNESIITITEKCKKLIKLGWNDKTIYNYFQSLRFNFNRGKTQKLAKELGYVQFNKKLIKKEDLEWIRLNERD